MSLSNSPSATVGRTADGGPGANHPYILKKPGFRSVPVRDKIQNRFEALAILKQLGIPKAAWPEKLK